MFAVVTPAQQRRGYLGLIEHLKTDKISTTCVLMYKLHIKTKKRKTKGRKKIV